MRTLHSVQLFIPIIDTGFAPQILLHGGGDQELGKEPGMSLINWVISSRDVVVTLGRPGISRV